MQKRSFHSLYSHGFVRAAVCVPAVRVADPAFNAERIIALAGQAHERAEVVERAVAGTTRLYAVPTHSFFDRQFTQVVEEVAEGLTQLRAVNVAVAAAFNVNPDLRHQRVPPISPFSHRSPSVYFCSHS